MSFVPKRKRDTEPDQKKPKAAFGDKEREMLSQNNEWPMYNHPDGGTVKITPWGALRQWIDPATGYAKTKFEDASFQEVSFEMSPSNTNNQCYELPTTPMSLHTSASGCSSPAYGDKLNFSPTNEAELYVVEGYGQPRESGQRPTQQYAQEQEHYLGMEESEDFSDDTAMC
ncbi:hypothetical protein METBIDRAFT_42271 [Metschnikowia bicuspidata var. bicuspidata NRRL YB-4993]|uniref:Uncharacterized protein n=1 Tax=Metschnikowia bicuspidata var. bicuspidata NRRL YB-4993 TaxID=869754 RepID=A0A1A0HAQ7_9ASCO|nr:hypothetical protein METBIDRAFT_42271 [Metschnikowia bicuspidata var. bicuspidata NRRL YB-4993]OBA20968.1 hypothetical protein METBIDRAFT_42271 [Metschnikowia bicuspidata var. bicuspidata NRRL YB-4993]